METFQGREEQSQIDILSPLQSQGSEENFYICSPYFLQCHLFCNILPQLRYKTMLEIPVNESMLGDRGAEGGERDCPVPVCSVPKPTAWTVMKW
ncbi:hypothetical protein SKAU_G00251520 [Synaphobranchus kaupii]|uniref:Uncharacterized protein n=1 Tax=Synaphobranchus kaupii TaxID=118154 RepID=A0A9Q1F2X0_SYNKA|nr:hypothetical protein SKAU_G00251520 [Synaphobranchus kaupii]